MPERWKPSSTFRRLAIFLIFGFGSGGFEVLRSVSMVAIDVDRRSSSRMPSAPIIAAEIVAVFSVFARKSSSVRSGPLQRCQPGSTTTKASKVQHALDVAQGHVEHHAQTRRQRLQEPDVRGRRGQFDVAHALAAHLRKVTSTPHFRR